MKKKDKLVLNDGAPDGNNSGYTPVDDQTLSWDELPKLRKEVVVSLINNQALHSEFCKLFTTTIEADKQLKDLVIGVSESFKDIAFEIADVDAMCAGKSGIADDIDDQILYIRVSSNYNEKLEKIATLMSNGYMDVFTELSVRGGDIDQEDITKFKTAVENESVELAKEVDKINTGVTNGEQ
jgi:hypothetical protein